MILKITNTLKKGQSWSASMFENPYAAYKIYTLKIRTYNSYKKKMGKGILNKQ